MTVLSISLVIIGLAGAVLTLYTWRPRTLQPAIRRQPTGPRH